jgi:hypothetical protein
MLPIKDFPLFERISTLLTRSASYVFSVLRLRAVKVALRFCRRGVKEIVFSISKT